MSSKSFLFRLFRTLDSYLLHIDGYVLDFRKLDQIYNKRRNFSKDGLIKVFPSLIFFRDLKLKRVARKYGGWNRITSPEFQPPEKLYEDLLNLGIKPEEFDLSREYIADSDEYRKTAFY